MVPVLRLLRRSARFADDLCEVDEQDPSLARCQFAVRMERLVSANDSAKSLESITEDHLRWMVGKGLIQHLVETQPNAPYRRFENGGPIFGSQSCFIITASGESFIGGREPVTVAPSRDGGQSDTPSELVPVWDDLRRCLSFGDVIVKQFRVPARNQETILRCFQEEGWPPKIDDPLSPSGSIDTRRRLHDTINSLNRCQRNYLLRFAGDGWGTGVKWETLQSTHRR